MQPWTTRSRRTLLDRSPWLSVESHEVELPDGRLIEDWPWVVMPDHASVVAVTLDGLFVVLRQTKYALPAATLATAGGGLAPGEEPLTAGQRELLEETGFEADAWTPLGRYVADGNRGCGVGYLFLATGARKVREPDADDLEEQEPLLLTRAQIEAALGAGEFEMLASVATVALALVALDASRA